jgi:TrmH family RNA methyltransferase
VTPGTVELTNPKVVRSAMGALFRFPAVVITAHERVAARCQESRLPLVLTSVRTGEAVSRLRAHPSVVLVLGGEAEGAGQVWESLADMVVRLPMSPTTESLNVAVAGGILLFRHIWYPSDEASEAEPIA